jgi:hypothetical protein
LPNFAKDFGLQKKAFCFILFCVRKFSLWYFLLFGCLFVSVARESKAQGTLDSLTIPAISGAPVIGYYVSGGVGWSFVPTSDILVTGIEASAIQFSFWQGSNQVLATFNVSSPNTKPPNSFAPIAPLFLSAGGTLFRLMPEFKLLRRSSFLCLGTSRSTRPSVIRHFVLHQ